MLLEALIQRYDAIPEPILPGFREVEVKWQLEIDSKGKFVNFKALYGDGEKSRQGKKVELPFLDRSGKNPPPCLIHDYIKYVFGGGVAPSNSEAKDLNDACARHESYLELLDDCIEESGSEIVKAIRKFLNGDFQEIIKAILDQNSYWTFDDRVLVLVDGANPFDDSVKAFWLGASASGNMSRRSGTCLVCGVEQEELSKFFKKVKGVEGKGNKGASLISYNMPSHEHYGRKSGENLSLCQECANRTQISLQALRDSETNSTNVVGLTWLWWTTGPTELSLGDLLVTSDISESALGKFLRSPLTGQKLSEFNSERFLAVALSSNPGRIAIRRWLDVTIPDAYKNLNDWFENQRIVNFDGLGYSKPLSIYSIISSLERSKADSSTLKKHKALSSQILESALLGKRIPWELGSAIIRRVRVTPSSSDGERLSMRRASIIKMFLIGNNPDIKKGELMKLELDRPNAAYQCGRLLSVLNSIQRQSLGEVNASIIDRFYGAASTTPRSVFPRLVRGVQPHLSNLRKLSPGVAYLLENRMSEIISQITEFPKSLPLQQQAEFALGFYHQRAHDIGEAKERKQEKQEQVITKQLQNAEGTNE